MMPSMSRGGTWTPLRVATPGCGASRSGKSTAQRRTSTFSSPSAAARFGQLKPTTREWFATARNYALYANQGGAYDDILKYLKL